MTAWAKDIQLRINSKYGLPYSGSKAQYADGIVKAMAEHADISFTADLFCGGGAIAHALLANYPHVKVLTNDAYNDIVTRVVHEKVELKDEYLSKEQFDSLGNTANDSVLRVCWSFNGNCRSYQFSSDYSAADFNKAKISGSRDSRNNKTRRNLLRGQTTADFFAANSQRVRTFNLDFSLVPLRDISCVYIDPVYDITRGKTGGLYSKNGLVTTKDLLPWAEQLDLPVFISEYEIDSPVFNHVVWEKTLMPRARTHNSKYNNYEYRPQTERLYWNGKA